ncbi:MAG: hypothetical protein NTU44_04700 [Bacteroidetes bacterium]|nr:hypothetical protein [Bacteroidota bacterium]
MIILCNMHQTGCKQICYAELFALDFTKKYRALNCNFILDEINFTVTNNAIKPAKVKAWTV